MDMNEACSLSKDIQADLVESVGAHIAKAVTGICFCEDHYEDALGRMSGLYLGLLSLTRAFEILMQNNMGTPQFALDEIKKVHDGFVDKKFEGALEDIMKKRKVH